MQTLGSPIFSRSISSVTTGSRSVLFRRIMHFLSFNKSSISSSLSSSATLESTTYRIKSASFAYFRARCTPIFSTTSSVALIPAVSMIFRPIPCRRIDSSRTSLVVPATSVTMALSSPTRMLRRDDLPALGFPTMTVLIPSFRTLPLSAELISFSHLPRSSWIFGRSFSG